MPQFPAGTVIFLFTDIERSTSLWERDAAATRTIVERYLAIVGQNVEINGGVHFKTIGDGTQSAFPTAPRGLAAALAAQHALLTERWPNPAARPKVRMALHAGVAEPLNGDYLAPCLNRLSRLLDAAHGEQILLSQTVAGLAAEELPADVTLAVLGEHRLRDILQPEEVFQLRHPALPADFPPLNTPGQLPHNLPVHPTPFLGRESEVDEAEALLLRPGVRLVTLTGPGGVGKTRLGLRVAAEALESFPDGVFLVDLARQTDPALVPSATAAALGLREQPGQTLAETLASHLHDRRILLVFDNFEHVLPAATLIADLIASSPALTVLATSRARLGLQAEHEYRVETLPVPDLAALPPLEELAHYDAIALFVSRAKALRSEFALTAENAAAVAAICARVDGLPLAIELAAARVKLLSPQALLVRLDDRLETLTGGARDLPARQRTVRDTIAWSHSLLTPDEATLFRRLTVFVGGWTLDGAEAVGAVAPSALGDVLSAMAGLVDQSLVDEQPHRDALADQPRYALLEMVREYAGEQLAASGEIERVRQAFEGFLIRLAENAEVGLMGPEQHLWLDRLDGEHANIRAALAGALERMDGATALCLAPRLWEFWRIRGYPAEGSSWLQRALAVADTATPDQCAAAEYGLGKLAIDLADYEAAERHFRASADLWQSLGDRGALADAKNALAIVKLNVGAFSEAQALGEEALTISRELGDARGTATALYNLGMLAREDGYIDRASELLDEALALWRTLGDPKWIALATGALAVTQRRAGASDRALALLAESDEIYKRQNDLFGLAVNASERGLLEQDAGKTDRAMALHADALEYFESARSALGVIESIEWIGVTLASDGAAVPALHLLGAAAAARKARGLPPMESEAPFIDAGLKSALLGAGSEAEKALALGTTLTLEQARDKALAIARPRSTS